MTIIDYVGLMGPQPNLQDPDVRETTRIMAAVAVQLGVRFDVPA